MQKHFVLDCRLCSELEDGINGWKQALRMEGVPSTMLWSTPQVHAMLPLGPLTRGHIMLVAARHVLSFAEYSDSDRRSVLEEIARASRIIEGLYGRVVVFEHGSGRNCANEEMACVDHAHLHIVPSAATVSHLVMNDFPIQQIRAEEFFATLPRGSGYLFFIDSDSRAYGAVHLKALPSQYMRKIIWQANNLDGHWDWSVDWRVEIIKSTRQTLETSILRKAI